MFYNELLLEHSCFTLLCQFLFYSKMNQLLVQFSSVQWFSRSRLCDPLDCNMAGLPVHHRLLETTQTHVHCIGDANASNHLILCGPLLFPPSIFPNIRVFSNVSVLHIRWPKYWSFSFSISPYNEYSGLISFRIDWLDPLTAVHIPILAFLPSQVIIEYWVDFPVLHSRFSLVTYFIRSSVYMSISTFHLIL